ncbi:MAG: endonuclease domain-containing protein [Nitrospirota bacterium]
MKVKRKLDNIKIKNHPILKPRRRELRHNQTEAEEIFWSHVRDREFQDLKFFRQYSVGPYILDFYSPAAKLAVELDGGQHDESDNRKYDTVRTEYLNANGINVMRFRNNEVLEDVKTVLAKLTVKIVSDTSLHSSPA